MKSVPQYDLLKIRILRSYILILFPISLFITTYSFTEILDARKNLTSRSVSVRGYYRNDETYVQSYTRRPPGGAKHDSPFEVRISKYILLAIVGIGVSGIGFVLFFSITSQSLTKEFMQRGIDKIKFKVDLPRKPYNLINMNISVHGFYKNYRCDQCDRLISNAEFHVSDRKKRRPKKWCLECAELGITDSIKKQEIFEYVELFNRQKKLFDMQFAQAYNDIAGFFNLDSADIDSIYFDIVKEMRKMEDK